ncbi:MAG TPA: HNH endonuclease signature motif containing protein [Candidatus Tectomicrobia bacterium]|nr:HNH endonuclease signature motif containing protein [Candidatus Tectomicrobia bacterium]
MANQSRKLRDFVEARADGCCEYCRRYQDMIGETFFEVEHIVPRARGGLTAPHNLAFACRRCNLLKGNATEAVDRRTGRLVPLYNPRRDRWSDHFRRSRDQLRIYGRTATGHATVALLRLKSADEQRARQIQRDYLSDIFPLS